MKLITLQEFDTIYEIMEEAFPEIERRSYEDQKMLLNKENYHLYALKNEASMKAFISVWEYDEFIFVEHLAIHHHYRNQGLGAKLLQMCMNTYKKMVVLEVELPNTTLASRRINFYKRLGFHTNESFAYEQPPLQKGFAYYPLWLMTYPRVLNEQEFINIQSQLYEDVYGIEFHS